MTSKFTSDEAIPPNLSKNQDGVKEILTWLKITIKDGTKSFYLVIINIFWVNYMYDSFDSFRCHFELNIKFKMAATLNQKWLFNKKSHSVGVLNKNNSLFIYFYINSIFNPPK